VLLEEGDGTVPRFSATPPELDSQFRDTFLAEKHGSLQASTILLTDLIARLEQMQVERRAVRGPELKSEGAAISVAMDDVFAATDVIEIGARITNSDEDAGGLFARVWTATGDRQIGPEIPFRRDGETWSARFGPLPSSIYRLEVHAGASFPSGPPPVHDLFGVE
jgi:hypothetical protein